MRLEKGGMDVFYVDESMDGSRFVIVAVGVPFMRQVEGTWSIVWEDQLENAKEWRRRLSKSSGIPVRKELKGAKLGSGRGRYNKGLHTFSREESIGAYRDALQGLDFLIDSSIIAVAGDKSSRLYQHSKLEALVYALLQRMQKAVVASNKNAMIFFDEGHGEYRKLYRKARVFLPTGSSQGAWASGKPAKNVPLDRFTKDANIKESQHSLFVQIADLVSYSLLQRIKKEKGCLSEWQKDLSVGDLYACIPRKVLNLRASRSDPDGIVRL